MTNCQGLNLNLKQIILPLNRNRPFFFTECKISLWFGHVAASKEEIQNNISQIYSFARSIHYTPHPRLKYNFNPIPKTSGV